ESGTTPEPSTTPELDPSPVPERPVPDQEVDVPASEAPGPRTPFAARTDLEPNTLYHVEGRGDFYTNADGRVTRVEVEYGGRGSLNADLQRLQPDATYVIRPDVENPIPGANHEHVLTTDAEGRVVQAHTDDLAFGNADRSESVQSRVGDEGGTGYDGGHLFGNQFGGGGEYGNLVAMLESVNRGAGDSFFNLENHWASLLDANPPVRVSVDIMPEFVPGSRVPEAIVVRWTENGVPFERIFDNIPDEVANAMDAPNASVVPDVAPRTDAAPGTGPQVADDAARGAEPSGAAETAPAAGSAADAAPAADGTAGADPSAEGAVEPEATGDGAPAAEEAGSSWPTSGDASPALAEVQVGDRLDADARAALAGDGNHGVVFFNEAANQRFYSNPSATLGAPGRPFFTMPLADGAHVSDAGSAARVTGMSPATAEAYTGYRMDGATAEPDLSRPVPEWERDIVGIVFNPSEANLPQVPTAADAGGYAHYLEGGNTAVRTGDGPNAGYLMNDAREFVIRGGDAVPPGSVLFRIVDGDWVVERVF
ncbi:DNA/RNA non-specific endonuclease, partial [Agrococcus baldri]|uniref:DNA/RNA non-specific endonuclease n=1 Tax=Agrococcus baldri TaxID=153730 RepID=UPI00296E90D2